ncbi:hypothetical protein ACIQU1_22175 [Streptomyces angustmyceticus]|uniref:hypothetical protein n=1 Tax=Streptomyces angustmyceticus TaxID=285578 RepID=UPI00344F6A3F
MTGRPTPEQAAQALRGAHDLQGRALDSRREPPLVKLGLGLIALACAACYDVLDHPGQMPLWIAVAMMWGYILAARSRRGAAALGFRATGLRNLPATYVAVVLAACAAVLAVSGFALRRTEGFLSDHVPYWHTLGILALIVVATALSPVDRRLRARLLARTQKLGAR